MTLNSSVMILEYNRGHIIALDGFRGIAILLVLIFHLFDFGLLKQFTNIGWVGVDVFFVLSGFLITGILLDNKKKSGYYSIFLIRRALRIFPLYYALLVLFFFFSAIFTEQSVTYLNENQLYFWFYLPNLLFALEGWPEAFGGLNHLWSLAIEEQFYLFWPFIVLKLNSKRLLIFSLALIASCTIIRNIFPVVPFAYVFTFARLDGLLMGSIASVLLRYYKSFLQRWLKSFFILSLSAVMIMLYLEGSNWHFSNLTFIRYGYVLFPFFFACFLLFIFAKCKFGYLIQKLLNFKFLTFLGTYSYGLYIYHGLLDEVVYKWLLETIQLKNDGLAEFSATVIILILSIALSYLSYHLFEKRFLLLKEKFVPKPKAISSSGVSDKELIKELSPM